MGRSLALLLALFACVTDSQGQTYQGFSYTVNGGAVAITDYSGSDGTVAVPSSIPGGGAVTSVGNYAFYYCNSVTNIAIPGSVTNIGADAFSRCGNLRAITVDANNAVYSTVNGLLFDKSQSLLVVCPEGFVGACTLPSAVTSISPRAFYECHSLTSVIIPNGVMSIGNEAFWRCTGLSGISIPVGVTNIGDYAFESCANLASVRIPYSVVSIGRETFLGCSSLTGISIPNGVSSIGGGAFYYCSSLTNVTIASSVSFIGDSAFGYCSNLTSAYFQGNAPPSFGSSVFNWTPSNFTIYYPSNALNWSTPTWSGYAAMPYSYTPIVQSSVLAITQSTGMATLSFKQLQVGTKYQLQISSDLATWIDSGSAFTATSASQNYPQSIAIVSSMLFFQLESVP